MPNQSYVLVTAAYNEEQFITHTIESVVSQTIRPHQWVIVSDASTDSTDRIVDSYSKRYPFIRLLRLTEDHSRNWAAQVNAINAGCSLLRSENYEFIGNLDADLSFGPTYFEDLLCRFQSNAELGLAGGVIREKDGSTLKAPRGETLRSVPHAVQLFRRECYEAIGGYPVLRYGGPDTYAEVVARMKGWQVEAFHELIVDHHRYTGSAGGLLKGRFRQGLMDFSLGYHPLFELVKCARRLTEKPVVVGALVRMIGFCWSYLSVRERVVPEQFVRFLRTEQRRRIYGHIPILRTLAQHNRS